MNTSGDDFAGYLRGFVGWVWVETFLISLFLFLMLFLFISREMMFAVVAVTTTVALLLALAGWRFKPETRQVSARGSFTEVASRAPLMTVVEADYGRMDASFTPKVETSEAVFGAGSEA